MKARFDFGVNWKSYSVKALDEKKFVEARNSLKALFAREDFSDSRFLDVGCGSGIFSVAAKQMGAAEVVGIDISQNSVEASAENAARFGLSASDIRFFRMDALDAEALERLGEFDFVYAWGSLHHTGRMWEAIRCVTHMVAPNGRIALAIYRWHWTTPIWKIIKWSYNHSPGWVRKAMIFFFYPLIFAAKFFLTGKNPLRMERGMDWYHDVVDWIGGWPYEAASANEMKDFMKTLGFEPESFLPAQVPTGNNQFVFVRKGGGS